MYTWIFTCIASDSVHFLQSQLLQVESNEMNINQCVFAKTVIALKFLEHSNYLPFNFGLQGLIEENIQFRIKSHKSFHDFLRDYYH